MVGLLVAALVSAGCSADERPEPTLAPPLNVGAEDARLTYDASAEPASAVLALVPEDATILAVTDFDQVRLLLGAGELTSADPKPVRDAFWAKVEARAPVLSNLPLRASDRELEADYGFTQDDVQWEATFSGPGGRASAGWVMRFHDNVKMAAVRRAVAAGVAGLAGAEVDAAKHLVTVGTTDDGPASWGADATLTALVGAGAANATYVERACLPFEVAFETTSESDLAELPAEDMTELEDLGPWSVTFGGELVTVRLGTERTDVFDRARLSGNLPQTDPEFGVGYQKPVADPFSGRIGFDMGDPAAAADLAVARHLPFAVCAG